MPRLLREAHPKLRSRVLASQNEKIVKRRYATAIAPVEPLVQAVKQIDGSR